MNIQMMSIQIRRRCSRGSVTVEASFLIPFLLMITGALICLTLYLHDRSLLAACASELAGKGAQEKYKSDEGLEQWLTAEGRGLAEGRLLALRECSVEVQVTKLAVTVTFQGETALMGGLEICETGTAKRLYTVEVIRAGARLKP